MGSFDWVDYPEKPCLTCGVMVNGWQSKDSKCYGDRISPGLVKQFYATCLNGHWNEYRVRAVEWVIKPVTEDDE